MSFLSKIFSRSAALTSISFALLTACSGGSSDPTVVAGDFTAYGVKGSVNGQNVTLDLSGLGNCATTVENMVIGVNANGASISPDPRVARDYSQPVQFALTAPDGTKAVYTVTVKGAECLPTPATAPTPAPMPVPTPAPVLTVPAYQVYDDDGGIGISNLGQIIVTDSLSRPILFGAATASVLSGLGNGPIPIIAISTNGITSVTNTVNNVGGGITIYKVDFTYTVGGVTYSGSFTFGANDNT